jgi:hypothetical protein
MRGLCEGSSAVLEANLDNGVIKDDCRRIRRTFFRGLVEWQTPASHFQRWFFMNILIHDNGE